MLKPIRKHISPKKVDKGFNITETAVTAAIIGTLGSIAFPNYIASQQRSRCYETRATLVSIPPIISAYIDATGEKPTTWDNLSSITSVMTNDGPANGELAKTPIILPRTNYELSIKVPNEDETVYSLVANCYIKTPIDDPENTSGMNPKDKDKYVIKSCFNVSNGASDLTSGSSSDPANAPKCG